MTDIKQKRRHSLSGRLVLLFIAMAAVIVIAVSSTMVWALRSHFQENIRPHLMQYLDYIQQDIGVPPNPGKASELARRLNVEIHYFGDDQQWTTSDHPVNLDDLRYHRHLRQQGVEYGFGFHSDREYLISRHDNYTLAFSVPRREHGRYKIIPLMVILAVLILLYYATRRLFAPIKEIKNGVVRIGSGELGHRLNNKRRDELGELGDSINAMADDIEQMLEAKRQLLLAISHELRSPLTRAKVSVAMLDNPHQQTEIQHDLDEMEGLIEELLETERLSTRHSILNKSATQIQTLIDELLRQHFGNHGIEVIQPDEAINMDVDSARIKLLLKNLLANAVQHSPAGTAAPRLTLTKTDDTVTITVQDHGRGIQAEHLPHLMEPFYRTDAARRRETGGYGLGLYLCKVIVEAHGGTLEINSIVGEGTTVVVSLPPS